MSTEFNAEEATEDLASALASNSSPFGIDDVAQIVRFWTDGQAEANFVWLLKLKDRRWVAASGWHDYTGWDCQSGFVAKIFASSQEAIEMGFTRNERELLGILSAWEIA